MDARSRAWVDQLRCHGAERDAAVLALHGLLLSAARFDVNRRCVPTCAATTTADLAQQSADDAPTAVPGRLDDFRGESRFTTWAYKFALFEAAVRLRRLAWQGREIPLEPRSWPVLADRAPTPQHDLETRELLAAVGAASDTVLSIQREVLVRLTVNDVPIDVLAGRLTTTCGALYKTLRDARRKLRSALIARGQRPRLAHRARCHRRPALTTPTGAPEDRTPSAPRGPPQGSPRSVPGSCSGPF